LLFEGLVHFVCLALGLNDAPGLLGDPCVGYADLGASFDA
jgi:hypothetical protein